jgi:hypothetical protein
MSEKKTQKFQPPHACEVATFPHTLKILFLCMHCPSQVSYCPLGSPLVLRSGYEWRGCPQAVSRESHRTRNKNKQTNKSRGADCRTAKFKERVVHTNPEHNRTEHWNTLSLTPRGTVGSHTAFRLSISSSWREEQPATLRCVATPHHHPSSQCSCLHAPVEPSNTTMCQRGLCAGTVRSFSVACAQSERNHTPCFADGCFMCGQWPVGVHNATTHACMTQSAYPRSHA